MLIAGTWRKCVVTLANTSRRCFAVFVAAIFSFAKWIIGMRWQNMTEELHSGIKKAWNEGSWGSAQPHQTNENNNFDRRSR